MNNMLTLRGHDGTLFDVLIQSIPNSYEEFSKDIHDENILRYPVIDMYESDDSDLLVDPDESETSDSFDTDGEIGDYNRTLDDYFEIQNDELDDGFGEGSEEIFGQKYKIRADRFEGNEGFEGKSVINPTFLPLIFQYNGIVSPVTFFRNTDNYNNVDVNGKTGEIENDDAEDIFDDPESTYKELMDYLNNRSDRALKGETELVKKPLSLMTESISEAGMSSDIFTLNLPLDIQAYTGMDAPWM